MVISRFKQVVCFPQCFTFNSSLSGYIFLLKDEIILGYRCTVIPGSPRGFQSNKLPGKIRLKKMKEQVCPERRWLNPHRNTNILFKYNVTNPKVEFSYKVACETTLIRVASVKYRFPRLLDIQHTCVEEKLTPVQGLVLHTDLIISERTELLHKVC